MRSPLGGLVKGYWEEIAGPICILDLILHILLRVPFSAVSKFLAAALFFDALVSIRPVPVRVDAQEDLWLFG